MGDDRTDGVPVVFTTEVHGGIRTACRGKVGFETPGGAQTVAKRIARKVSTLENPPEAVTIYTCPHCAFLHIGTVGGDKGSRGRRRNVRAKPLIEEEREAAAQRQAEREARLAAYRAAHPPGGLTGKRNGMTKRAFRIMVAQDKARWLDDGGPAIWEDDVR